MVETDVGMKTELREAQNRNVRTLMAETEVGIEIELSEEHE